MGMGGPCQQGQEQHAKQYDGNREPGWNNNVEYQMLFSVCHGNNLPIDKEKERGVSAPQ
jgi:hypothetical protein